MSIVFMNGVDTGSLYFLGRDDTGILSSIKMESNYINRMKDYVKKFEIRPWV